MLVEVNITEDMIEECYSFARKIILGDNQYDRLPSTIDTRIERTFVGKLAELAFHKYLTERGKEVPVGDMFDIYDEQNETDRCDFATKDGKTIDVKSASRIDHYMIMVPIDQFESIPKDYYIGVKINTGVTKDEDISIDAIKTATIYGYCEYSYLERRNTKSYGEGPCKAAQLERLLNIERLISRF